MPRKRIGLLCGSVWLLALVPLVAQQNSGSAPDTADVPGHPAKERVTVVLALRTDPDNVQFDSYLRNAQAAVKNALATSSPAAFSAGNVTLQFAVVSSGQITKLVIGPHSGDAALYRAAVAAVSSLNPLPVLPAEFKGQRIVIDAHFQFRD